MALNFPSNPTVGQIYTVNGESWQWDGHCWIVAPAADTYSPVFIGGQPPLDPNAGDLWWNSTSGRLCIYYTDENGSQWVSATQPQNQILDIESSVVVAALLDVLQPYDDIAAAAAGGIPTGGLFKITGATDVTGIRTVSFYA